MVRINSVLLIALSSLGNLDFSRATSSTSSLNLTAISAANGSSILECWQLPGLEASAEKGTAGALSLFLGNTSNTTYSVLPARFNGGLHNAPAPQFVIFLSGLAYVTLPNVTKEAWIEGGRYGAIIAVDTTAVSNFGHFTTYPSDAYTVALQIPFEKGVYPNHTVLHHGPCTYPELTGA